MRYVFASRTGFLLCAASETMGLFDLTMGRVLIACGYTDRFDVTAGK